MPQDSTPSHERTALRVAEAVEAAQGFRRTVDARLILSVVAAGIVSFSCVVVETAMNVTFPALMAESFPLLILGRVLEGVGMGIAPPLMFIIIEQAPREHMGAVMGGGTLVTAVAPAVGPSVGDWLALAAAFVTLLAGFVTRKRRADATLIHLSVFDERRFVMGVVALVCLQFVVLGLSFLLPNYSQLVMGTGEA